MKSYSCKDSKKDRVAVGTCELVLRGGSIDSVDSSVIEEYVKRQGEIIDIVNSKLEEWNQRWDERTGKAQMEEESYLWYLYSQFIGAYERMVCINDNFRHMNSRVMTDCIFKEGITKIIGIIDNKSDLYLEFIFPGEKDSNGIIFPPWQK